VLLTLSNKLSSVPEIFRRRAAAAASNFGWLVDTPLFFSAGGGGWIRRLRGQCDTVFSF